MFKACVKVKGRKGRGLVTGLPKEDGYGGLAQPGVLGAAVGVSVPRLLRGGVDDASSPLVGIPAQRSRAVVEGRRRGRGSSPQR